MKKLLSVITLITILTGCVAQSSLSQKPVETTETSKTNTVEMKTTGRTFKYEKLPMDLHKENVKEVLAEAEISFNATDSNVVYHEFQDIVTAKVVEIGVARNYSEKKKMFVMPYSPITIIIDKVMKGSFFKTGETITIFVEGGYLPYREMEKSFVEGDAKAEKTKKMLTEIDKDNTYYFENFDGSTFPELNKKYIFHIYQDKYGDHFISGWGLSTQEINDKDSIIKSQKSVTEYFKSIQK